MSSQDERYDGDERLRCGRSSDAVLEQVVAGRSAERDKHQSTCVHCEAALAEYGRLWSPMQALARERIAAPQRGLDRILQRIRGAVSDPQYAVLPDPRGVTRIAARVVLVTARRSAQSVPGVRVALSRGLDPTSANEPLSVGVAGESTAVEITLAADYGSDLNALAEQVRLVVTDRIQQITGLRTAAVTVIIDDVLTRPEE